ncbi:MAG: ABC transporter ATP-binding protein [Desulfatiglandales bacterium]
MIQAQKLTKYYGDLRAVNQIDFEIRKGEILGLLGPNGAGKTTVLRMMTGYLKPTSGTILVKDYDIRRHPLEIKRLMGYLPESAPLYDDMLVYDYLDYIAAIRRLEGERKLDRIRKLTDICGLRGVMHQPIDELSKGYKQRVGLAHAMMSDPEILVLDEPTSGLDPNQIIEIREIIRRIGKEKTVILSTHILNEAEAACDRVLIINRGDIVGQGTMDSLKRSAGSDDRIHLSLQGAHFDQVEKELGALEGVMRVLHDGEDEPTLGLTLICRSSEDLRGKIYQRIKATDWVLLEFYRKTESLENIFRELTKEN